MPPLDLPDVQPAGDLRRRMELNFRRLHDPEFHFDAMRVCSTAREAPGDWIGRALLGLTLHAHALDREAPHRLEILDRLPEALNSRGYIGTVLPTGCVDENQIGGHNALLCGLAAVFQLDHDERALTLGRTIIRELFLPIEPLIAAYPDQPPPSLSDGSQVGLTVRQSGVWCGLSTDIGIAFFTLDALTRWQTIDPDPALDHLIETMARRYEQIDPVAIGAQTHGTLSTLRGLLRWRPHRNREHWLQLVRARHQAYLNLGRTEHHGNLNWFGRPAWTEACAIVDSFILALELWSETGDPSYLDEAHRVFHNALAYAQRPNGGYGCDCCVGANGSPFLEPHEFYEAPWCCTMRGAEGLAETARWNVTVSENRIDWLLHLSGRFRIPLGVGDALVEVDSKFPKQAEVNWKVIASTVDRPVTSRIFLPEGVEPGVLRINGQTVSPDRNDNRFLSFTAPLRTGDHWEWLGTCVFRQLPALHPEQWPSTVRYAHGPLLLGCEAPSGAAAAGRPDEWHLQQNDWYRSTADNRRLSPLNSVSFLPAAEARHHRTRLLFQQ